MGRQFPEVPGRDGDRHSAEIDVLLEQEDGISVVSDDSSEDSVSVHEEFSPRIPITRRARRTREP